MAKGAIGKQEVISRIATAFGTDYIGEVDKKVYVWANENGERIQIALSLTCPKNPVAVESNSIPETDSGDWDFSDDAVVTTPVIAAKVEITQEEKDKVLDLMKKLGL